jgi:hypothetical protein
MHQGDTTVVGDGNTVTPNSPSEVNTMTLLAQVDPASTGSLQFFYDGGHLGQDFNGLAGASGQGAQPALNQCVTDLKALLGSCASSAPNLLTHDVVPQFAVDVINASIKAPQIGSPDLDKAYGGALVKFFGSEAAVIVPHAG